MTPPPPYIIYACTRNEPTNEFAAASDLALGRFAADHPAPR
jgi:hypothetical protein